MKDITDRLLSVGPLDPAEAIASLGDDLPELSVLHEFTWSGVPLLERVGRTMQALREGPRPPAPAPAGPSRPWWAPVPAAYVAALLEHVGLAVVARCRQVAPGRFPPHARQSAKAARSVLRRMGVPFTIREHAVALIRHQDAPRNLVRSGAPAAALLRLACRLEVRSLYWLKRAEALANPGAAPQDLLGDLEALRARARELDVFGSPPPPPLGAQEVGALGFQRPRAAHRALNAMRYFHIRAGMADRQWFLDRLERESRDPRGRLNLLIGPAGCGKSTWARQHLAEGPTVSSDRMRAELTGDPADQSQNYLVFQRCAEQLRGLLKEGATVTFDATNYMEALRELPVRVARWSGAEISSYFFDVDLQTALDRNRMRPRCVPEHVIRRHLRLLTPPALYESDRHWVVAADGEAALCWPAAPTRAGGDEPDCCPARGKSI